MSDGHEAGFAARPALAAVSVFASLVLAAIAARAFQIEPNPVHQDITREAFREVSPDADGLFIENVVEGVKNADYTHQFKSEYHFDNSRYTGDQGFSNGFDLLYKVHLSRALQLARTDPLSFLHPRHRSLGAIVQAALITLTSLGTNELCVGDAVVRYGNPQACPVGLLIAKAGEVQAQLLLHQNPDQRLHPIEQPGTVFPNPDPHDASSKIQSGVRSFPAYEALKASVQGALNGLGSGNCPAKPTAFWSDAEWNASCAEFSTRVAELRATREDLDLYEAWQDLGHAFHAVQDFFAHSNYVELMGGRRGPPCSATIKDRTRCDEAIKRSPEIQYPADVRPENIPVPAQQANALKEFSDQFSQAGLASVMKDRAQQLETGCVIARWEGNACYSIHDVVFNGRSQLPGNPDAVNNLRYCHYDTLTTPGLNKDIPSLDEPAHLNYDHARRVAKEISQALWRSFRNDLVGARLPPPPPPMLIVEVEPKGVLAPGVPVRLIVHAYDKQTMRRMDGLPFQIAGSVTGATETPINNYVPSPLRRPICRATTATSSGACPMLLEPPSGTITARAPYPATTFTLNVPILHMHASVAPDAIKEGPSQFTVSAVDVANRPITVPVSVYVDGKLVGAVQGSRPLQATFQAKRKAIPGAVRRVGEVAAIVMAPALWVSAPGYSDAVVPYRLIPAG